MDALQFDMKSNVEVIVLCYTLNNKKKLCDSIVKK